jgi:hypothetical protein
MEERTDRSHTWGVHLARGSWTRNHDDSNDARLARSRAEKGWKKIEARLLWEGEGGGCGHHINDGGGVAWRQRLRTAAMARVRDLGRWSAKTEGTGGVVKLTRMVRRRPQTRLPRVGAAWARGPRGRRLAAATEQTPSSRVRTEERLGDGVGWCKGEGGGCEGVQIAWCESFFRDGRHRAWGLADARERRD